MDGVSTLHLLDPFQLGHRLTLKPVAGWSSPPPTPAVRLFAAPGVGSGPRLCEEAELRWVAPTPVTRTPPPSPEEPRPVPPALPSTKGFTAQERDGAQTRAKRRNKSMHVHLPLPHPWTNQEAVKDSSPGLQGRGARPGTSWPCRGRDNARVSEAPRGGGRAARPEPSGTGHRVPGTCTSVSKAGARPILRENPRVPWPRRRGRPG